MKRTFATSILLSGLLFAACNENTDKASSDNSAVLNDTVANSRDNTMVKPDTASVAAAARTVTDKDVIDFVQKAAAVGTMEVNMGKMVPDHTGNARIKDFGSMMVADHTQAGDELKSMAARDHIDIIAMPDPEHKKEMDNVMSKKDKAFDKVYMDMMLAGHKKTIDMFKKASTDLKDEAYKAFAVKTLPVLQKHLDSVQSIQKTL